VDNESDLAKLLVKIEAQRERAAMARRLAFDVARTDPAADSLQPYAEELEVELEKLEAQAAVLKQAANQAEQEASPEQSIAALKPPADPEHELET
jgi:hypothetical protein